MTNHLPCFDTDHLRQTIAPRLNFMRGCWVAALVVGFAQAPVAFSQNTRSRPRSEERVEAQILKVQAGVDQLMRDIRKLRSSRRPARGLQVPQPLTDETVDELMVELTQNLGSMDDGEESERTARGHLRTFTRGLKRGVLSPMQQAKALAHLEDTKKVHAGLAEVIDQQVFSLTRLMIGSEAPNIVGKDVDGVEFELNDYRGKVVAIFFTGDWCGPCRGEYPYQRAALEEFKDRPFTILGVNSDKLEKAKTYKKLKNLHYRTWFDGGSPGGPIAREWGVRLWPTVYMLDAEGVIRFTGTRGERLLEAAKYLLDEMDTGRVKGDR